MARTNETGSDPPGRTGPVGSDVATGARISADGSSHPTDHAGVYVCAASHRTPVDQVKRPGPVIPCPHLIGLQMQCGRNARLWKPADVA